MTGYCWRSIYMCVCVCISDSFHTNHTRYSCLMIKQYMVGALRSFILLLIRFKWMQTLHGANNIKIFNKQCEHAWFMCLCLFYFFIIFASYGRLGVSISLTLHQDLKYYSLLFFSLVHTIINCFCSLNNIKFDVAAMTAATATAVTAIHAKWVLFD